MHKHHRPMRCAAAVLVLMLLFAALGTQACLAASSVVDYNACGIVNRPLSVDPTGRREGFSAVLYDNSNGLPTSEANAIAETSDGFLWIGSYAGLIRYDGNTFDRLDSTGGLTSIKSLYVDREERLWIGTNDNGVAVMEHGEVLRSWGKLDGMVSSHVRAITGDPNGLIYVATNSGVMTVSPDFTLNTIEDESITDCDMRDLRVTGDGTVYGSTDTGSLMIMRDGKLVRFISKADNPLNGVGTFLPDPEHPGIIYHEAADFGLHRVDVSEGFVDLETIDVAPLKYLRALEYIDGKLWICAGNGIGVLENGVFTLIENLPMNNSVCRVMTDYLGNLWFASSRQGVMKVVPNQFSDLFERYGLDDTVVNSTCMVDGNLFIGTDTGLMVLGKDGLVPSIPLEKAVSASGADLGVTDLVDMLKGVRIRSVIRDSRDRIWISTWRACGLLRYDHGQLMAFNQEDGLMSVNLRTVSETKSGDILVAVTGGVNVIRGDQVISSTGREDGIVNTESLTVVEGTNGDIVLGSNGGGIYIINESGVRCINVEEGLPSDIVMRLKQDPVNNVIWIVTSSAIAYMTPDYRVTTVRRFPYPNNFDLYEASNGDMWVLASSGIYVLPASEMLANGEINPVFYSQANGLSSIATANSYSDLTPDGNLYIAGTTGVCKVNIEEPMEDVNNLKMVVPYVEADGVRIYADASGNFTIPASTQKLTVPEHVFNYSLSNPQVSYKLEGFDKHSVTVNRSDLVPQDFTNLRGGTYHFVMQLKDAMGRGSKVASVPIIKEKQIYEHPMFIGACVLAVIVLVWQLSQAYFRRKNRKAIQKQKETAALIDEITKAFAKVIDMKDAYTKGHSTRVAQYTVMLAREMGIDEETVDKYYHIALLHDIGKIGVRPEVLNKRGKLTDEEFEEIKAHTSKGYDALKDISIMPELAIGAGKHHERPDGRGYPDHLKGDQIPQVARIIGVADCFDAMYSNRPYRNRMNFDKVVSIIREVSGTQLAPEVVEAFLRLVARGEFRDPDDHGGGSMENIENIHNKKEEVKPEEKAEGQTAEKAEAKAEEKAEGKAEEKAEGQAEKKAEVKTEEKADEGPKES